MKKIIVISLSIFFLQNTLKAQEDNNFKLLVMGVPQHLIIHGIRVDFDYRLEGNKWLIFSPQLYLNKIPQGTEYLWFNVNKFEELLGFGMAITQKNILSRKSSPSGFYIAYGATYNYTKTKNADYAWVPYVENTITYYDRQPLDYEVILNKIGGNAIIGYQNEIYPKLILDGFIGFGLRYSFRDAPENTFLNYSDFEGDYGYTGTLFVGGIRLGVAF
ncbi:hypothetical protein ACFLSA_00095 [Bacteroidota bacterium]